jgi:hypothetical protein
MKRVKYKRIVPKYYSGGTMTSDQQKAQSYEQGVNSAMSAIPVYGMFHNAATGLSKIGQNAIPKDEYGYATTNAGQAANDFMENSNVTAGKFASRGDYGGAAREVLGFGKTMRTISTLTGHDEDKGGFWGNYNRISGQTSFDTDRQGVIDAATAEKERIAREQAEADRIAAEQEKQRQTMYNNAYYSVNSMSGNAGANLYASGGNLPMKYKYNCKTGGTMNPIASDIVKVNGPSHEQGGVKLQASGTPIAEVEGDEVIHDNRVFSDRSKLGNKTYAEIAEKLGKKKEKFEEMVESSNFRDKNTAERMLANIDNDLNNLFRTQEASKTPEERAETTPIMAGGGFMSTAQAIVPLADNFYNAQLINQTPEIPKPNQRVAMDLQAVPLRTSMDVSSQLASTNDMYRNYNSNLDQNTANSNVARANKLAGLATTIRAKNDIYNNKNLTETGLINNSNMNIQNVNNSNIRNHQDITNQNYALLDNYNMGNALRQDNILKAKSQNVANATDDAMKYFQDRNMRTYDEERIMTDALRYNDASGYARMIGTPTMDNLMKNPQYYNQVEKALLESGQTKAYAEFKRRYGKQ